MQKLSGTKIAILATDGFEPVAAICHGPWLLVEADALHNRKVTSYHSIRTDVKNAGAGWADDEVVIDGNLITSRAPQDLPAFIATIADTVARARP